MHYLDWFVIGGYFVLLLLLGFYKSSKNNDDKDFILAGRRLSLPGFVATLVATWYGGIMGIGENTYNFGIQTWFIFGLPYYIFGFLFAIFLAPRIRNLPHRSIPDHFNKNFGKSAGIISAVLILILASPAPYILSLGILLQHTLQWNLQTAILFATGISLIYIWFGGFRAVIRTDILQFVLMFLGFILLLFFSWKYIGSPASLVSILPEHYFNPTGGNSFQYILVWFFIAMWTFIDPGFYQRTAAAKSPDAAKKGILISIGFWFIFDILTVTTGLYAAVLIPNQVATMAYPELASRILPPFVYGLFLVGLFSTIMSTIDSNGLISAITFGRDILWRIQGEEESSDSTIHIRKGLVVMAFIAVLLAISIPSVVRLWYVIGSIIVPGILLPFLLTFSKIKLQNGKAKIVIIMPVIIGILWFMLGHYSGHYPWGIEPFYPGILISILLLGIWMEKNMKIETERKFLVKNSWKKPKIGFHYSQGYINTDIHRLVRIRVVEENKSKKGFLTIKGSGNKSGMSRYEFEVEIPVSDAENLLLLCDQPLIEKTRYKFDHEGLIWEIDEFHGINDGLIIAEVELKNEDQKFSKPDFIDKEITGIIKYYNFMLQKNPYTTWDK